MRTAYALLGLLFIAVLAGAAWALSRGGTPYPSTTTNMNLMSSAFEEGGVIPSQYTCDGPGKSPALSWDGVPENAKSLALIMDDHDVPKQVKPDGVFDHWVLFNIPPESRGLPEGGTAGVPGQNGAGAQAYMGPCPPPQYEPSEHRYTFSLYALDAELALPAGATKEQVLQALQGHILAQAQLVGKYRRR